MIQPLGHPLVAPVSGSPAGEGREGQGGSRGAEPEPGTLPPRGGRCSALGSQGAWQEAGGEQTMRQGCNGGYRASWGFDVWMGRVGPQGHGGWRKCSGGGRAAACRGRQKKWPEKVG